MVFVFFASFVDLGTSKQMGSSTRALGIDSFDVSSGGGPTTTANAQQVPFDKVFRRATHPCGRIFRVSRTWLIEALRQRPCSSLSYSVSTASNAALRAISAVFRGS